MHLTLSRFRPLSIWLILSTCGSFSAAQEAVPVVVAEVREMPVFRPVEITGTVTSPRVSRLSPAIGGLVLSVAVEAGDRVGEGDLLLDLDAELARLQWQSSRAEQARAAAALEDSRRRLAEAKRLAPQRSIAETAVRDLEAEVAEDSAAFDRAKADSDYQRALLARHRLKAPFAGVISEKLTEQGEWISPGQAVLELVATAELRMDFAVAEDHLVAVQQGAPVEFTLNAFPGRRYPGRVQTVVPVTDPGARTFLLRVVPDGDKPKLMPGMSVHAVLKLPAGDAGRGLVVSRDAMLRFPDGRRAVWVVEAAGGSPVARERHVRIGETFDGMVEVREGLNPGDRVVVQGNEALQDGQAVRIVQGE